MFGRELRILMTVLVSRVENDAKTAGPDDQTLVSFWAWSDVRVSEIGGCLIGVLLIRESYYLWVYSRGPLFSQIPILHSGGDCFGPECPIPMPHPASKKARTLNTSHPAGL